MTAASKSITGALAASADAARRVEVELPHRDLWSVAGALIDREEGVAFLDGGGTSDQGRWSILGWRPRQVVVWPQGRAGILEQLRRSLAPTAAASDDGSAPFHGGWMGWFSYDVGRHFERLPEVARADASIPDFALGEYDMALVEDRLAGKLYAVGRCADDAGERDIVERAERALRLPRHQAPGNVPAVTVRALVDRSEYQRNVERILAYIRDGAIYQANYSHRFTSTTTAPSAAVYGRLRAASPAPFGCYIDLPGAPQILSASPELFLRKVGERLQTRPIKGTRPRGGDAREDEHLRAELETSEKERAELLMITDLLRNDLGRVAAYGSVAVRRLREIESHPTVHHAYSVIEATLRDGLDVADVIAATMPGGSVTGAPKIRAMEILDELEPLRRGPYSGAAGFIGYDGDACLNILIRTLVRQGEAIWYQVGGGIVADSDPDAEYEETLAKGAALQRALQRHPPRPA